MNEIYIKVKEGVLLGALHRSVYGQPYYAFFGIPYAQPPIDKWRFKDPQPPVSWINVLDASIPSDNNISIQRVAVPYDRIVGDENCLHLNIYVPYDVNKLTGIAVMVWFHGGNFTTGSDNYSGLQPDYLIDKDVIIVTVNYRLGVFGFFNLGHEAASGNQGMKDQIAALQWIRENITEFGGDPNNITLFGFDTGAVSVHLLMLSPLSEDLFHKAILQSGVATMNSVIDHNIVIEYSYKLADMLGTTLSNPAEIVEFLQNVPTSTIVNKQFALLAQKKNQTCSTIFGPTFDGYANCPVLPKLVSQLLPRSYNKPMMIGNTSFEFLRFLPENTPQCVQALYDDLPTCLEKLASRMPIYNRAIALMERFKNRYFNNQPPTLSSILRCHSDIHYNIPINNIVYERTQATNASTYLYEFSYVNQEIIDRNLSLYNAYLPVTTHGDELPFLFYMPIYTNQNFSAPPSGSNNFNMIQTMTTMWTNFAKTGVPVPVLSAYAPVSWFPAIKNIISYMKIDRQLSCLIQEDTKYDIW